MTLKKPKTQIPMALLKDSFHHSSIEFRVEVVLLAVPGELKFEVAGAAVLRRGPKPPINFR